MKFGEQSLNTLSEELSGPLSKAVTAWYDGPEALHDTAGWRRMLRSILAPAVLEDLLGAFQRLVSNRGIDPASNERAEIAMRRAINATDDIRKRILAAPVVASSKPFSIRTLLKEFHQKLVASSIIQHARDLFLRDSVNKDPRMTGRVRWENNSKNSRHADLEGVEFNLDEGIEYRGEIIHGPRANPADVDLWSGCSCNLLFETNEGDWI